MAQTRSHESTTPVDRIDDVQTQAPSSDAFTAAPGRGLPKDGTGNWGVAARWFMFALLAIAFVVALYVLF
jgi:hypothetical protein